MRIKKQQSYAKEDNHTIIVNHKTKVLYNKIAQQTTQPEILYEALKLYKKDLLSSQDESEIQSTVARKPRNKQVNKQDNADDQIIELLLQQKENNSNSNNIIKKE